jgi:signal peptidase I
VIDEQTTRRSSFWRELPILLGVAIVVAILVRAFVLQTFYIPSQSMENTLQVNDRVLVNKVIYNIRPPQRGEIVVFRAPAGWRSDPNGEDFIKRVIGIGGDRIQCCDGEQRLIINGQPLDEPYLYSDGVVNDVAADDDLDVTVPEDRLWVMGDHRSASGDSLEHYRISGEDVAYATIPTDAVVGRAFVLFWPPGRATSLSVPQSFQAIPDAPVGEESARD